MNFGLELLSTVDFLKVTENINTVDQILRKIENWSDRKRTLFATKQNFVKVALDNINQNPRCKL